MNNYTLKDAARAIFILALEKANELNPESAFMMEENCEDTNDVREISIGKSKYSEYRQKAIMSSYAKTNGLTKEQILEKIQSQTKYSFNK